MANEEGKPVEAASERGSATLNDRLGGWVEHPGVPEEPGKYLMRMDECDDEDEYDILEVRDGRAYAKSGFQRCVANCEWKRVEA